jgi:excisionase family DNA binding protein
VEWQATTHADELTLFTPREAAQMLSCSVNGVYRLIAQHELKTVDIAPAGSARSKTRIRRTDLEAFINARTQGPAS